MVDFKNKFSNSRLNFFNQDRRCEKIPKNVINPKGLLKLYMLFSNFEIDYNIKEDAISYNLMSIQVEPPVAI